VQEDNVTRNAAFAFVAKMVGAVLTAVLTIFLGRRLSQQDFGAFTFALSVALLISLVSDLSISSSSQRFISERRDDLDSAADVVRIALRSKLVLAFVCSVALFAFAVPVCKVFGVEEASWAVRGIAISAFSETLFLFVLATFVSVARIRYNALIAFVESATEVGASVVLVLLGAGAAGAAFGRAIGYAVGLAVGLWFLQRLFGSLRGKPQPDRANAVTRDMILRYAAPLIAVDVAFRLFESIDALLIAAILGSTEKVAAFGLPMRLAAFLDYPVAAIGSAVAPRLARGARGPDLATFVAALRLTTLLQLVWVAPLLVWPETIIHLLFGDKYPESAAVLRALVPFVVLGGVAQLVTVSVNYLGEGKKRVPIAIIMITVNIVIDVALLSTWGVVAAAVGTSVAYTIWVPSHIVILRRSAGMPVAPIIVTTLRGLVAAAVMSGVLLLIGTGELPLWRILLGAVLAPIAYIGSLVVTRELRRDDATALRRLVRR
jgi:O-antigen/teichoic acid export membrane protein